MGRSKSNKEGRRGEEEIIKLNNSDRYIAENLYYPILSSKMNDEK